MTGVVKGVEARGAGLEIRIYVPIPMNVRRGPDKLAASFWLGRLINLMG
jgi:hypothetical protein